MPRFQVSRLSALLFEFLSTGGSPVPSDAIFVFAGRTERKRYGLELWKRGLAPILILSVGRFEWRRFPELGLSGDGGLTQLVEETNYKRRHFFVTVESGKISARFVATHFLGTFREARGLAEEIRAKGYRSVLVVSSSAHLRRVRLAMGRALGGIPVRVAFTAVPERDGVIRRDGWSRWAGDLGLVAGEMLKLPLYWFLCR